MAQMRPATFPNKASEHEFDREHEVFELLRDNLPEEATVLYEPRLFNKRRHQLVPDFVLFWQQTDCVVIEVKNWDPKSILHGDDFKVYLENKEKAQRKQVKNPYLQAKDYMFALWDHVSREAGDNAALVRPETGRVDFCVTPVIVMLKHTEEDIKALSQIMGGVSPDFIISGEALRDPQLLRWRLKDLPFAIKRNGDKQVLLQAADVLRPTDLSEEDLDRRSEEKSLEMLPTVQHEVSSMPEKESDIDQYKRLRGELRDVSAQAIKLISADVGEDSPHVLKLQDVVCDLERDELRIGLFGVTAAGKSTFINALLGEQLMRPGLGETSKTITELRGTTEAHAHKTSVLIYKTYEELRNEVLEYLTETDYLTSAEDVESFNLKDASTRDDLQAWFGKQRGPAGHSEESARKYIRSLLNGWDQYGIKLDSEEEGDFEVLDQALHARNTGESMAVFVKKRQVFYDNQFTSKGFVFIDSPGVGSSLSRHTRVAEETARNVDTAILLTQVAYKFMPADREFVRRVIDVRRKKTSGLLCVLNQIGEINPLNVGLPLSDFDNCVDEECDKLRERLADEDLGHLPIFPVDSKCAYYAKRATAEDFSDDEKSQYLRSALTDCAGNDLPSPAKNLKASRFSQMEEDLYQHLTQVKYRAFAGKKLSDLEDACEGFKADIQAEINAMDQNIEGLNASLEQHRKSRKSVKRQIDGFMLGEFNEEVALIYGDIDEVIGNLHSEIQEEAKEIFKHKFIGIGEVNLARFVKEEIVPPLQNSLVAKIKDLREVYERKYETLKEHVVNKEIPEIISNYGDGMNWKVTVADLDLAREEAIQGLCRITPNFSHEIWAFFKGLKIIGGNMDKKAEYLSEAVKKQYCKNTEFSLTYDLVQWIENDKEGCRDQIQKIFEDMAEAIENRIKRQIESRELKSCERKTRTKQLIHYSKQIGRLLDECMELRAQVDATPLEESTNP